ncbi:MAG TPA: TraB family protein [Spirochaetaceae bacterium]|nr:TraB family protein [Spirochaetaceae bacterium]
MTITQEGDTIKHIVFDDGRHLTVVGSAHISQRSVDEVKQTIEAVRPDCICIELDEDRWVKFHHKDDAYEDFDLIKAIRQGKFFLIMVNVILSSFQKRLSKGTTGESGREIIGAGEIAIEKNIPLCFADRKISLTLKRAWAKSSLFPKSMILASLFASAFDRSKITEEELDQLKQQSSIDKMLEEMSKEMPSIKTVLIDERDRYLASIIYSAPGENKFAIVGQGHVKGLLTMLEKLECKELDENVSELDVVPKRKGRFLKDYFVPIVLVSVLVAIGIVKGWRMGAQYFAAWAMLNALTASVGAAISLAHPLTILATAITSPVSALTPVLGVGMVAGLVEATVRRSRVRDLDTLSDDVSIFKRWFGNRILHTFLILIVTTFSSAIGTFAIFPIFRSFLFKLLGWS